VLKAKVPISTKPCFWKVINFLCKISISRRKRLVMNDWKWWDGHHYLEWKECSNWYDNFLWILDAYLRNHLYVTKLKFLKCYWDLWENLVYSPGNYCVEFLIILHSSKEVVDLDRVFILSNKVMKLGFVYLSFSLSHQKKPIRPWGRCWWPIFVHVNVAQWSFWRNWTLGIRFSDNLHPQKNIGEIKSICKVLSFVSLLWKPTVCTRKIFSKG
jgi:hypothetical protein